MEETPTNVEETEDETSFANLEQNRDDNSSELEESSDEEEEEEEQEQREEEIEEVEKVEEELVGDSDIEINYNSENSDKVEDNDDHSDDEVVETHSILYKNSSKTMDECVLAVLELYIKHKMTKESLKDTLTTICNMLPQPNNMPTSFFKLLQYTRNIAPECSVTEHFYCKKCRVYDNSFVNNCCQVCLSDGGRSVFYDFDISQQIRHMFEHRNLAEILNQSKRGYDLKCY